jgi:hypothetical protein
MRMPRYQEMRPSTGAYVAFYCESCNHGFNSNADVGGAVGNQITNALLRQVPLLGSLFGGTAQSIDRDAHWHQVEGQFAECVQCKKVVCRGCHDGRDGRCARCRGEEASRQAQDRMAQVASSMAANMGNVAANIAGGLGALGALGGMGGAAALAFIQCPSCNQQTPRAHNCQACGRAIPETMLRPGRCSKCSSPLMPGARFCPRCGGPAA